MNFRFWNKTSKQKSSEEAVTPTTSESGVGSDSVSKNTSTNSGGAEPIHCPTIQPSDIKRQTSHLSEAITALSEAILGAAEYESSTIQALNLALTKRKQHLEVIQSQNETRHYPLTEHISPASRLLERIPQIAEERQTKLVHIYGLLRQGFWQLGVYNIIPKPNRSEDVERIDWIKTLIDLYNIKIRSLREDTSLSEDNRMDSVDYLKRLRERDVALLEGEA